jgi:2,3-bisphosphoglycerate-dependent phosphoglycerate mutase
LGRKSINLMTDQSDNNTPYHITLLRHGESQGNFEGRHQGQADFPLTDHGRDQIKALANRWITEHKEFDLITSSPLLRARESAQIIATALNVSVEFDSLWMERDNGLIAGLSEEELRHTDLQPAFVHPYQPVGQTGESQWELYLRAGNAVQSLFKHPPGKYLIVSHGGLLNMFFYAILGISPQPNFHGPRFRFTNSAFATLTYYPTSHHWFVLGVNDHIHCQSLEN